MAVTRLMPLHVGKGRTISTAIRKIIGYSENPLKTDNGNLVTCYGCDARTADDEFMLLKQEYEYKTGRNQGDSDIIAYHIRQSFKPGEITPEEANKIGYELAMSFTKGKHQFVIATHIDRAHIHNHIIFNSTAMDCTRKFRNFWGSARAVRRINDRLCIEHGLSVVDEPKPSRGNYGEWLGDDKPLSFREQLRKKIDAVLNDKPADMESFIKAMKEAGCEIKRGKYLSLKAPGQKRFIRLRSLGDDYSETAISERISGKRTVASEKASGHQKPELSIPVYETPKVNLLIDIQNSIKAKNSPGYERWAKIFNLKEAAQTIAFLQENKIADYEVLKNETTETTNEFHKISDGIKQIEKRLTEIKSLQKHISDYSRTRDTFVKYRQAGYSKKFYESHEGEIILHKAAKKAFEDLKLEKLPTIKTLQTEYATLDAEKKKLYSSYHAVKEKMQALVNAKHNTDRLLNYSETEQKKESERTQR